MNRRLAKFLAGSTLCSTLVACVLDVPIEDSGLIPTFSIGGTVKGAAGPIALQNSNGTMVIVPADGRFAFETPMVSGAFYRVTVVVPPNSQGCVVARGAGTVAGADISDVTVTCASNTYASNSRITASSIP